MEAIYALLSSALDLGIKIKLNKLSIKALTVAVALAFVAGCSAFGGDDEVDLSAPVELEDFEATLDVSRAWRVDIGPGIEEIFPLSIPVLDQGILFAADPSGDILAIDADTGRTLWKIDTDTVITGALGVNASSVFVGTQSGEVQAFDRTSGDLLWRSQLSSEVLAPPGADDSAVIAVTIDGKVTCLDALDGSPLWSVDVNLPLLTVRGNAKPTIEDGVVYLGLDNGKVAAHRVEDGISLWELRVGLPEGKNDLERMVDIDSSPIYHNGNIYVSGYQSGVMAINPEAGRGIWFQEGSSTNSVGAYAGTVVAAQDNGVVKGFNASDGTELWDTEKFKNRGLNAPAVNNDFAAFADSMGYLHLISRRNGEILGRQKIGDGARSPTLLSNNRIYVLSDSGKLSAYDVSENL